jgi:PTH2 family peptidyl-tRNA hydrolase
MEKLVKQYIIVRTDLPMNAGKVAAQASHACMKVFFDKFEHTQIIQKNGEDPVDAMVFIPTEEEKQWINGKFTKITKKVKNESQLLKVYEQAREAGLSVSIIKDAGLYGLEGENYTCIAVGPNYVDDCEPIVGKLRLLTDLKIHEEK